MRSSIETITHRAIASSRVRVVGTLSVPRSYGVYKLRGRSLEGRRFRFGNYPVRQRELEREFGQCTLEYLFLSRDDARNVAIALNDEKP